MHHLPSESTSKGKPVAVFLLCLFLLSPVVLQAFQGPGKPWLDVLYLFNLVTSLLWLGVLHSSAGRPAVLHLLLFPFYVTTTVDLFLLSTFGTRLSSGYMTIALTDYPEFFEFISTYARPASLALVALACIYVPCLYVARHLRTRIAPKVAGAFLLALLLVYGSAIGRGIWHGNSAGRSFLDLLGHEMSAPFGVLFQAGLALHLHVDASEMRNERKRHFFGASKPPSDDTEIYVWVIGESSRPQNWSLFGYARDTTPRLQQTRGIIPLPDVLTTAPHTGVAVPSMLSLRPITQWAALLSEKSIIGAFNETGFATYWLSTQEVDSWASLVPQLASEARRRRYYSRAYDGALLEELRSIVMSASRGDKVFIVLHTKGSHFQYDRRYPAGFGRFDTSQAGRRERLVNEYDNSVLYTDWFLSEVIKILSAAHGYSALVYASDHGENLLDDERGLIGHALGNSYDLRTAAFIWLSDRLRERRPGQLANVQHHATARLNLSNLPHSILDLAGIRAKGLEPSMSVFDSSFVSRQRSYMVRGKLLHESEISTGRNSLD